MDLELSDAQEALRDSVRDVLQREAPVSLARQVVEEGKGGDELWARLVALDWPAVAVGDAEGGLGLGTVELAVVAEELGRVVAPGPWLATATQFVPALASTGPSPARDRFLAAVAAGQLAGTLAVAEADGLGRPEAVTATATDTGDGVRLAGEKHLVLEAGRADELVVAARRPGTAGADGLVLVVVPVEAVTVRPLAALDATRQLAAVGLDGVEVGAERVLADAGGAGPALERAVEVATVALCAEVVGTCQGIFDIVHDYLGQREQFGVKIGSFQALKHKLANMYVALESARATTYFAAAALDEDDDRRALAVSMAKSQVGDCQKLLAQEGIQCLGGIGYTWEHDMHLFVKRAKTASVLFGTAAWHRQRVADLIGL